MTANSESNGRSASTRWRYTRVKIAPAPQAYEHDAVSGLRFWHLSRWNGRKPLTVVVTYRGGPECWYEVKARNVVARFPGSLSFHDVLDQVYGGERRSSTRPTD